MTGADSYSYGERRIYASTPMIYDIEAAQYLYAEERTAGMVVMEIIHMLTMTKQWLYRL